MSGIKQNRGFHYTGDRGSGWRRLFWRGPARPGVPCGLKVILAFGGRAVARHVLHYWQDIPLPHQCPVVIERLLSDRNAFPAALFIGHFIPIDGLVANKEKYKFAVRRRLPGSDGSLTSRVLLTCIPLNAHREHSSSLDYRDIDRPTLTHLGR